MNKNFLFSTALFFIALQLNAQTEPGAGNWKTWFITSGKAYRLPAPSSYKEEIAQVLAAQQQLDAAGMQQILFWNAGAPNYHWKEIIDNLWMSDAIGNGILARMLLNVAIYDATVAAWDTKYTYKSIRPFAADKRIKTHAIKPESPSYPCEYSVSAGAAVTIIAHFFPKMADSVNRMAKDVMASRIAAGVAFPNDTKAGFELGKKIAEAEIAYTKNYLNNQMWDGQLPAGKGLWNGQFALFANAGKSKTVAIDSGSQFRPGPPPDFAKDMAELKNFKQTESSMANALYYNNHSFWEPELDKKIFECNLHLNAPRAARMYAIAAIGYYDSFVSCFDAKYAYWGIRPEQYDTTFKPLLFQSPPFPGYPSGHAAVSSVTAQLYSYFFPEERTYYEANAKDVAESRFQGGIHFRTDNEVALELGKKVAAKIIEKVRGDGADNILPVQKKK